MSGQSPVPDEVTALLERLKPRQEAQGYFFNPDRRMLMDLLAGLLVNRERYGYMSCPCRLASGDRGHDRDIICPCDYREADVAEYGACYCALYVSRARRDGQAPELTVPERRPLERMIY
ncbi:MAG: ferredoxin:thioredoxin reductase [Thermoleophilia bacterium]|nr:ferredoxin:thioredoxin reductase [Thermoleophilia bacterium]